MSYSDNHKQYMLRAIELAQNALGSTYPNPAVGCVIVKDHQIISESATCDGGSPHAEARAIEIANNTNIDLNGADLYVTLEPCSHHGKNPPCAAAIIESGISRVFVANKDPFFKVNGKGIQLLRTSGIEVVEDFLHEFALDVNKYFFSRVQKNRPYITLKIAASLDGKIALASGDSKWITSQEARDYGHVLRAKNDGILTGIGTVLADNPSLNCRVKPYKEYSPIKFIIDRDLRTPLDAKILKGEKSYIITSKDNSYDGNAEIIKVAMREDKRVDLVEMFENIANIGISSILVEAGQKLLSDLVRYDLVDEIHLITAPKILGGDSMSFIGDLDLSYLPENKFEVISSKKLGGDILTIFKSNHLD